MTFNPPKCPKCENTTFEVKTVDLQNSQFKIAVVKCTACDTAIGVTETHDIPQMLRNLDRKLSGLLRR